MIKREMTIRRLVQMTDRCVAQHMHQVNASQGQELAQQLLAQILALSLSQNLVYVNNRQMMRQVWEMIDEQTTTQLPLMDFLNGVTMQLYMNFFGQAVLPEDILAFGVGALHPVEDTAAMDDELVKDLPEESALKKLYRDNRWFVTLLLVSMSDVVADIPDSLAPALPGQE